ncbi:hypothetical protein AA313_de0200276 [Arthrobotrys entomopaga]|nr:hypothetical protein AA313_de0200276 [Arthrobotrys entomopaga]
MLSSILFTGVRVLEIIVALPIIGMLAWFVHPYVGNNQDVPDDLLTLFIVSILACAWALLTLFQFHRYRSMSGPFIAIVDICFVGAWIAGIYLNRGISDQNCSRVSVPVGIQIGDNDYSGGDHFGAHILAIIDCVLFFITCLLSWTLYRHYRYDTRHVHKEYTGGRRSGSTSTYSTHRRHRRHGYV